MIVPCSFNLIDICEFCISKPILGGQTLAGISNEYVSRRFFLGAIISRPALTLVAGLVLWIHCAHVV